MYVSSIDASRFKKPPLEIRKVVHSEMPDHVDRSCAKNLNEAQTKRLAKTVRRYSQLRNDATRT